MNADTTTWGSQAVTDLANLPDRRKAYLLDHGWRYHAETGFWWTIRGPDKYRSHESVLTRLRSDDFVFIAKTPEKFGCASVPVLK